MSIPHYPVVIIGGGPGGLALAQGLKKNGIAFRVYERSALRADYVQGFRLRISAYSPGLSRVSAEEAADLIAAAHASLFAAVAAAGVGRLILVGGVGSLQAHEDRPGDVVDADFYPKGHRAHTLQNREILRELRRGTHAIDWTYVSPPLDIFEGPALGRFRIGGDVLLRDSDG